MACGRALFLVLLVLSQSLVLSKPTFADKIKHVIVLMEENRSFDHFFGWYPGVNGLNGTEYNLVNASFPNGPRVYVNDLAHDVAPCDPDHSVPGTTNKIFGVPAAQSGNLTDPDMSGFVEWECMRGNFRSDYCAVMSTFNTTDLPVMTALASEFILMDRFFCAVPGPTWPNRLYMLSATSAGMTETGTWFMDQVGQLYPQPTIFDQVASEGMTWKHYFNDTPWELFLESVAHNPQNVQSMEQFYIDAQTGNLPNFAWINPRAGVNLTLLQGSNDDHPDHDVALGEQYYKDIYEALRASPQWNETLFVITYDEHGGFYDHVPPPMNVPPPGDNIPSYPDSFDFNRLGIRIPTLLISPWLPKGMILSEPPEEQKPADNSEYTLTSIMATARILLGMSSGPLTKRDAWSATFEQVFNLTEPRTDCPEHLPAAPPPAPGYNVYKEAALPINGLQMDIMRMHADINGEEFPAHIKYQGQMSEWAQNKFYTHAERHTKWQASKLGDSDLEVLVQPGASKNWYALDWMLNAGKTVKFNTLSVHNFTLCLDYASATENASIGVSPCYPSWNPDTNRDPMQQWVWGEDAMVRPFANPSLCLTTLYSYGNPQAYLQTCSIDNVGQHFSWQGSTNFGAGSGAIGWGPFSLGVINATSAL